MARYATGPNGEKLILEGDRWVPINTPPGFVGPVDSFTGHSPQLGRTPEEQNKNSREGFRTFVGSLLANTLSLPHAGGELFAAAAAAPALIPGGKTFSEARAEEEKRLPAAALLALPDPSTEDVLAVPGAIRKSLADPFIDRRRLAGTRFAESVADEKERASDSSIGTGAGQLAGDIATMLTLRPGRRLSELLPKSLNPRAGKLPEFPSRLSSDVKATLDAAAARLTRGTGRAVEAGFDGAVMGAIGDSDPVKTAAWTAGIQAGGSAALAAKSAFIRNPIRSFATLWFGHQIYKWAAPGPQQAFESSDAATAEVGTAFVLGTLAAMAGASRGGGSGSMQRFVDAYSSTSRAAIASVVTQLQEANNQPHYARVLELMSQDQERFGTDARVRLERAARSEEPRALLNEIDALMTSTRFRKALEEPDQDAQPSQGFADWLMRR